jgi:hypothetical protein
MALRTVEIEAVIRGGGLVKLTSSIGPTGPQTNEKGKGHVDYSYKTCNLIVGEGEITLNRVSNTAEDTTFNSVNVITTTNASCLGPVRIPGYVYTDNFSGCVFYLYKEDATHVIGVHAHQGLDTVQEEVRYGPFKLFKKMINREVRKEYGPQEYMKALSKAKLCRHETRGQLTDEEKTGGKRFLAFLSCVELDSATTFLYSYEGRGLEGNRILRLVDKFVDEF